MYKVAHNKVVLEKATDRELVKKKKVTAYLYNNL